MVLPQPVLETIVPVALVAVHARHEARADCRLAVCRGAGLFCDAVPQRPAPTDAELAQLGLSLAFCPRARLGALVGTLRPVVEAEGLVAGLAVEGEEVELVAKVGFAVLADKRGVSVARTINFGHVDIGGLPAGRRGRGRGGWVG